MLIDDETELEAACFAVGNFVESRRRAGRGVPPEVLRLHCKLTTSARAAMSADGPGSACATASSEQELIDATETAQILGCSPRHARRLARDLDAQRISGHWIYVRHNVTEYQEARHARGPASRAS